MRARAWYSGAGRVGSMVAFVGELGRAARAWCEAVAIVLGLALMGAAAAWVWSVLAAIVVAAGRLG